MINQDFTCMGFTGRIREYPPVKKPGRPPSNPEDRSAIAARLKFFREAMFPSQVALSQRTGIETNTWNNYESDRNRISLDQALILCRTTGLTLDWIYRGDASGLPMRIADALATLERQRAARN